jgi:hypothetical protein
MPSFDCLAMQSRHIQEFGGLSRMILPTRRRKIAWCVMLGLAFSIVGAMTGCGGSDSPLSPERKEKQEVVQDKMKDFMKQSKLPNRPR